MAAAAISKSVLPVALLLILAISQAHAISVGGTVASVLDVVGKVFCSPDGNACPTCRPVVGAKVIVLNKDTKAVIATTITAEDGSFKATITASAVVNAIISPDKMVVRVPLPATDATCSAVTTVTGALEAVPKIVDPIVNGLAMLRVNAWVRVTVS